jgi:hypothetical protein
MTWAEAEDAKRSMAESKMEDPTTGVRWTGVQTQTRLFRVDAGYLDRLTSGADARKEDAGHHHEGAQLDNKTLIEHALRQALKRQGVSFDQDSSLLYDPEKSTVTIRNAISQLEKIRPVFDAKSDCLLCLADDWVSKTEKTP